jgi:hypothetical protein
LVIPGKQQRLRRMNSLYKYLYSDRISADNRYSIIKKIIRVVYGLSL